MQLSCLISFVLSVRFQFLVLLINLVVFQSLFKGKIIYKKSWNLIWLLCLVRFLDLVIIPGGHVLLDFWSNRLKVFCDGLNLLQNLGQLFKHVWLNWVYCFHKRLDRILEHVIIVVLELATLGLELDELGLVILSVLFHLRNLVLISIDEFSSGCHVAIEDDWVFDLRAENLYSYCFNNQGRQNLTQD